QTQFRRGEHVGGLDGGFRECAGSHRRGGRIGTELAKAVTAHTARAAEEEAFNVLASRTEEPPPVEADRGHELIVARKVTVGRRAGLQPGMPVLERTQGAALIN